MTAARVAATLFAFVPAWAAAGELKYLAGDEHSGGSLAVAVGDVALVHTTQLAYSGPAGAAAAGQTELVLSAVADAVTAAGGDTERIIKLHVCAANDDAVAAARDAIAKRFPEGKRPAVTFVVGKLADPAAHVAIDAVAVAKESADAVRLVPNAASAPIHQAAVLPAGRRIYISGQAEKADTPAEATRKTLASLRATLEWLGLNDSHVVQCKSFLGPISAQKEVTQEFVRHFGEGKVPPLVFVEWESTLPIEIELIATAPGDDTTAGVEFLTPPGMTASPVYCRVARVAAPEYLYTCGLVSPQAGDGAKQVTGIFERLGNLLKETGSDYRHLVKATYYVSDDDPSAQLNALRPKYYDPKRPPAASKAAVAGTGLPDRTLTIDMIAVPVTP